MSFPCPIRYTFLKRAPANAASSARFRKVYLIGHGKLTNLYHTTLLEKGFDPKILTPDIIANGHFKLMKTIERNVS